MKIEMEPAFILHTRPFKNNSLLVDFFCQYSGRITAIAHGARSAKSKKKGLLQVFNPLVISCRGLRELKNLNQVEPQGVPPLLQNHALISGLYLNELLTYLLPSADPYPELFNLYTRTIYALQNTDTLEVPLRIFEKTLLQELGYALDLQQEAATGKPVIEDKYYHFHPESGLSLLSDSQLTKKQTVFLGKSLIDIANDNYKIPNTRSSAKRLMRQALQYLLGDRSLKTKQYFLYKNKS
jgi:DNA repair protein RecO (recombination protein O)